MAADHHAGIRDLLDRSGADVLADTPADFDLNLIDWLERTQTPPDVRPSIVARFDQEIGGGPATGLRPHRTANGEPHFTHTWVTAVARRRLRSSTVALP